ncbi:acyltransferase [Halobacillus salinarum]|uniref:Acyltransferase n=1 Tax=Halobacillus salinarum TaxID=2932257 RepID=A0ABY4EMX6_9BACI|nr:acyltransferase [Halobacillus salinarum]UOQ45421.1 acyltransferase [Halobacillus salinarum]
MAQRRRLSIIQISRAIAILFVLLGHVNILFYSGFGYDWFHMGSWERTGGVDFFFIVSGFMIYYLYHKRAGTKGEASKFMLKRLIRIYPLYWIFTGSAILISLVFPALDDRYSLEVIMKSIFILPTQPVLSSTWSLSHVMFFYCMFAFYIFKPKVLKPMILGWVVLTVLLELNIIPFQTFLFSFSTLEILLGSLVAYVSMNYAFKFSSSFIAVGLLGYLFIWINMVYGLVHIHNPSFYCLSAMIMMLGIAEKDKKERHVPKSLSFLGDASYSIYIAHGPFLHFYIILLDKVNFIDAAGFFVSMAVVIVMSTLSSCLVYLVVEKPMSKYLRQLVFSRKKVVSETRHAVAK